MRFRNLGLALSVIILLAGTAAAQQPFESQPGVFPKLGKVRASKEKGMIDLGRMGSVQAPKEVTVTKPVFETVEEADGTRVTVTRLVEERRMQMVPQPKFEYAPVSIDDVHVFDLAWKPVSIEKFRRELTEKPDNVILLERSKDTYEPRFDASFLERFKEGTLIVVVPAAERAGAAPPGALVPAPGAGPYAPAVPVPVPFAPVPLPAPR